MAQEKLAEASDAMRMGEERPVTASQLAVEVEELAGQIKERIRTLLDALEQIANQRHEFETTRARVEREIAQAKEEFQAAAENYAPSSCSRSKVQVPQRNERSGGPISSHNRPSKRAQSP